MTRTKKLLPILFGLGLMLTAQVNANRYAVDIQDTDIREFAEMVGKLTGNTYILDSRLSGKLNIRSQRQLNDDELINLFVTELKLKGFALVEINDGSYKIIPQQNARLNASPVVDSKDGNNIPFDQLVTRIIHLDHVNAGQMVPVLRPLVDKKSGYLFAYPPTNSLIIVDGQGNTSHLADVASRLDQKGGKEVELICLDNANASDIASSLSKLLSSNSSKNGNPAVSPVFVADRRTNCILVKTTSNTLRKIREVIAQLDSEISRDNRVRVFYLKFAKAESVQKVLKGVAQGVKVQGSEKGARKPEEVRIEAHPENNALVLSGPQDQIQRLGQVIAQLDIRRAQVHVEAVIVELSDDIARNLGVQWLFGNQDLPLGGTSFNSTNAPSAFNLAASAVSSDSSGAANALGQAQGLLAGLGHFNPNGTSLAVLVNALQADSNSNVLSTPSLMVMDNEEASILVGENIPVVTGSVTGDNNSNPFTTVKREDIGVKLKVTPQINEGDTIRLNIFQEVSALAPKGGAQDVVTSKREIKTTIQMNNGDTLVLGGLTSEELTEVESKVPLLGDLPILGNLFRSRSANKTKRHLAVFLKPTVIRTQDEARSFSGDRYSYIRARQLLQRQEEIALLPDENRPLLPGKNGAEAPSLKTEQP
ncbi:MAG: type II secretion system secretin GspD [Endozoicomonas sp.]